VKQLHLQRGAAENGRQIGGWQLARHAEGTRDGGEQVIQRGDIRRLALSVVTPIWAASTTVPPSTAQHRRPCLPAAAQSDRLDRIALSHLIHKAS
jgi:hypothetical protein